jgi:hypothetical protein
LYSLFDFRDYPSLSVFDELKTHSSMWLFWTFFSEAAYKRDGIWGPEIHLFSSWDLLRNLFLFLYIMKLNVLVHIETWEQNLVPRFQANYRIRVFENRALRRYMDLRGRNWHRNGKACI